MPVWWDWGLGSLPLNCPIAHSLPEGIASCFWDGFTGCSTSHLTLLKADEESLPDLLGDRL